MKPWSWDKQLGLASPLKCAAIQSGQTKNPSKHEVGLDVSHHTHVSPEGRGKCFFLDILFHRKSAENGFGAVSRCVLMDGLISKLPQSDFYFRVRWVVKSINFGRRRCVTRKLREIQ